MKLESIWTEIAPMPSDANVYAVFDRFSKERDTPFIPIVDHQNKPLGVVREKELKAYAFGRFGRELIKRQPLKEFIRPITIVPSFFNRDELLAAIASNQNPDGIVITHENQYRAVLFNNIILKIFETHRLDTQTRLIQAQKMEAIGTLAGGIAHDLNNILTPIIGYAELIRDMLKTGEPIEIDYVDQILVSSRRAREAVGRILSFSRHQKTEQREVSLNAMVKEVLRLIGNNLPATIDIEHSLCATRDAIFANPVEMHQVIMNLCTNAYQAMRDTGGHLSISLADHQGPLLGWSLHQGTVPAPLIRMTIKDTGTGIPEDVLPKIFEPFFTTKKQDEGTGLGLAIVHGVITRYKGCISVETSPGKGTTFHIYLPPYNPRSLDHQAELTEVTPTPCICGSDRRIKALYVDDEYQICRLAQRHLARHGIDVEMVNESPLALTILKKGMDDFDVLVTDQTMPSLTGMELARRALDMNPDFPIVLCTGFSEMVSVDSAKKAGIRGYLLKPPDFRQMASIIHELVRDRFSGGTGTLLEERGSSFNK